MIGKNIVNAEVIDRTLIPNLFNKSSYNDSYMNFEKAVVDLNNIRKKKRWKCLFVNYWTTDDNVRNDELKKVLQNNIDNKYINKIYLIVEDEQFESMAIENNSKIKIIKIYSRPTYSDIFSIINDKIKNDDDVFIFANADIYFDDSLKFLDYIDLQDKCLALTRYDIDDCGNIKFHNRIDSQDSWIFQGRIKNINAEFYFGKPGCDNRIAYEIFKSGYDISNPSLSIKSYHLHVNKHSVTYDRQHRTDVINKPYKYLQYKHLDNIYMINFLDSIDNKLKKNRKIILHLAINSSYQIKLNDGLKSISDEYYRIEWRDVIAHKGIDYLRNYIIRMVMDKMPSLLFMQIQTKDIVDKKLIDIITSLIPDIIIVNWSGDVREPLPEWYKNVAKNNKVVTCFSNQEDVDEMKGAGCKSFLLRVSYNEDIYNIINDRKFENMPKIIFSGNHYHNKFPLSYFRSDIVYSLKEIYGNDFQVLGFGWDQKAKAINVNKRYEKEKDFLINAKIVVGINHFNRTNYTSDRLYKTMACGTLYLCHYFDGVEKLFKVGEHLDTWHDKDELIKKINYYLKHDKERKKIAEAGSKFVVNNERWINRMTVIKKIMKW